MEWRVFLNACGLNTNLVQCPGFIFSQIIPQEIVVTLMYSMSLSQKWHYGSILILSIRIL